MKKFLLAVFFLSVFTAAAALSQTISPARSRTILWGQAFLIYSNERVPSIIQLLDISLSQIVRKEKALFYLEDFFPANCFMELTR